MVHLQYIHQQGGSVRVVVMMVVVTMMMSAATQNSLPRMDGWMDGWIKFMTVAAQNMYIFCLFIHELHFKHSHSDVLYETWMCICMHFFSR